MTQTKLTKNRISKKAASFTESVIREMTREALKYGAVNLGQGFPDFAAPADIKRKAMEAIADEYNQYAITWGVKSFRTQNFFESRICPTCDVGERIHATPGYPTTFNFGVTFSLGAKE